MANQGGNAPTNYGVGYQTDVLGKAASSATSTSPCTTENKVHQASIPSRGRCRARRVSAGVTASVAAAAAHRAQRSRTEAGQADGQAPTRNQIPQAALSPQFLVQMLVEMGAHPLFMKVVRAYAESQNHLSGEKRVANIIAEVDAALQPLKADVCHLQDGQPSPAVDRFMVMYSRVLERFGDNYIRLQSEMGLQVSQQESAYKRLMLSEVISTAVSNAGEPVPIDDVGRTTNVKADLDLFPTTENGKRAAAHKQPPMAECKMLTPKEEEEIQRDLKRRYAGSLVKLKLEFLKRRKKGKLPKDAKNELKTWWCQHILWPYPSEDDKKELQLNSGLSTTQINNWFINQRKRHWHKLFPSGPPNTPLEAQNGLKAKYGSLKAALSIINSHKERRVHARR